MKQEDKKMISVLFTRYYSTFANFIYWVSGRGYTHASIALDIENEYYYSFNFKGFCKEYPKKHKKGESVCYLLEITVSDYKKIAKVIEDIERTKNLWHYSSIGLFLCLLHIPHKLNRKYFCSQFVAELLQMTETVLLKKETSLYLPNQLYCELEQLSSVRGMIYNPI